MDAQSGIHKGMLTRATSKPVATTAGMLHQLASASWSQKNTPYQHQNKLNPDKEKEKNASWPP